MEANIYNGKILFVYRDETFVYISFPGATIHIPHGEAFNEIFNDLSEFVHLNTEENICDEWEYIWDQKMGE